MRSILGIALLCLAHAASAQQVRCVSTVAQLEAAMQIAANEEVEIRLVTGTYDVTQTCLDRNPIASCEARDNKIRLRGGYNSGCTARSADPALTVITAPGRQVDLMTSQDSADIAIDRLTFRNMDYLQPILEGLTEGNYSADIDRVWFDQIGKVRIQVDTLSFRNSVVSRSGFGDFNGPSSLEFDDGVLLSRTPTKPTGMPISNGGAGAPAATRSSSRSRAVGALPISTTAWGQSARARSSPMAARVEPAGASGGAQSSSERTGLAKVRRAIGATAAMAMAVSVRMGAPDANTRTPWAQAPGLYRNNGAIPGSPLLCTSRSSSS